MIYWILMEERVNLFPKIAWGVNYEKRKICSLAAAGSSNGEHSLGRFPHCRADWV